MHVSPNGKRYIGITSRKPEYRWNGGRAYKNQPHFQNAIHKYGWDNIQHVILFSGLSKDEAVRKEIELIAAFETTNPSKGYNTTLGGEGASGVRLSAKTKAKMSAAHKERMKDPDIKKDVVRCLSLAHSTDENKQRHAEAVREAYKNPELRKRISDSRMGENNHFYGKHHSEETRMVLAEKSKGRCGAMHPRSKPVLQIDMHGNVLRRFASGHLAYLETGVDYRSINACVRGRVKSAGGFRWQYAEVV